MANFKMGDEVVCIDASSIPGMGDGELLSLGKIYEVLAMGFCQGYEYVVVYDAPEETIYCRHCDAIHRSGYLTWRFIKLDKLSQDSSLEKETQNG